MSCQTYGALPLDAEGHMAAWRARTPEIESLRAFQERQGLEVREPGSGFDWADGLDWEEGRFVALVFNPALRMARLRVGLELAGAEHAGRWADPEFSMQVLRITEGVPEPWVVTPELAISIPLFGRLGAERDLAGAEVQAARAGVIEAEWELGRQVQGAWIAWSAARLVEEESLRFVESLDQLTPWMEKLAERGEVSRADSSLFQVEQARRSNELRRLAGETAAAKQILLALMGLAPDAPVTLLPDVEARRGSTSLDPAYPPAGEAHHPVLLRLQHEYQVSEQALRAEVAKQYPDLTLGPLLEWDEGRFGAGLGGGFPLPFFRGNRRAIAEARAARQLARAAFEVAHEELVGRYASAFARFQALADQRADMEASLIPLVDQQVTSALEILRLGEGTALGLLESLTRAHQVKLDWIHTRSAEAAAQAELNFLIGSEQGPAETLE
ncbi:MAG: TolC family protein [Planctomycetes bacterium]|nr:TolC family protein [Planctomycetota bacterium]